MCAPAPDSLVYRPRFRGPEACLAWFRLIPVRHGVSIAAAEFCPLPFFNLAVSYRVISQAHWASHYVPRAGCARVKMGRQLPGIHLLRTLLLLFSSPTDCEPGQKSFKPPFTRRVERIALRTECHVPSWNASLVSH